MMKKKSIAVVALSIGLGSFAHVPSNSLAAQSYQPKDERTDITMNGVRYKSAQKYREALEKIVQIRLEQVPKDYLKIMNMEPTNAKIAVVLPTPEEARLAYIYTQGLIKNDRFDQRLLGESVITEIKIKVLSFEKIGFLDKIAFVSEEESKKINKVDWDFVLRFQADFDGVRTAEAVQYRKTDWVLESTKSGRKKVAFSVYGPPAGVGNDLQALAGMRDAVEGLRTGSSASLQPPQMNLNAKPTKADLEVSEVVIASLQPPAETTASTASANLEEANEKGVKEKTAVTEDLILKQAVARCREIGFDPMTAEYRSCVTQQIAILSK